LFRVGLGVDGCGFSADLVAINMMHGGIDGANAVYHARISCAVCVITGAYLDASVKERVKMRLGVINEVKCLAYFEVAE
jgi:hypothetical protein